ncbi:MAG: KdsC family phosphatase [Desulfovibrio sp.]
MNVKDKAAKIKMLILDCDGVLTDGGLYYDHEGPVVKRFNAKDGLGIKLAQRAGLKLAVVSGLQHKAVETRMDELGIDDYYAGFFRKVPVLEEICGKHNLQLDEIAFLGDDWVDAGAMLRVGLPMAVLDAVPEILNIALWTSTLKGGHGAVREAIHFILQSQGLIEELFDEWK